MKAALCFLIFSAAIAIIFAEIQYEYDEDEYDGDDENYELAPQEDTHLSLFQLIEGLEELQNEMTVEKRGKKKGRRRKSKGGRKFSKNKLQGKLSHFRYSLRFLRCKINLNIKRPHPINVLRLLIECFILVGSAMFGVTFNLVTCVG